ncbi:MAG: hypothetical protein PHC61_12970 [Chitinivibrionales bacterium]|nr:hypothetical protein [Chitinivibrionales bacterium]
MVNTYLKNCGSPIYFPAGAYKIGSTINTPAGLAQWGGLLLGAGRDTKLLWYGASGGTMIKIDGAGIAKWQGLDLDGRGIAANGIVHDNTVYDGHERFRQMAFHNFTSYGFYKMAGGGRPAQSETFYENCIFDHCATGIWAGDWNDLDWSFTG